MVSVLVKVDPDFKRKVDVYCASRGISKKALIVTAVQEYMLRNE